METLKVFKLFRKGDGPHLYPIFIDYTRDLPLGEWLTAWAPSDGVLNRLTAPYTLIDDNNTIVKETETRPTHEMLTMASLLQMRWVRFLSGRYYDLGLSSNGRVIPFSHRAGWHTCRERSLMGVNMEGKVWAECLIPANDYYTLKRNINGMTHKSQPVEWLISRKIYINKIL